MYTPRSFPRAGTVAELETRMESEFLALAQSLQQQVPFLQLQTLNVAPTKPREGMIALADGTNWNPGGTGAGFYGYRGAAWRLLG